MMKKDWRKLTIKDGTKREREGERERERKERWKDRKNIRKDGM